MKYFKKKFESEELQDEVEENEDNTDMENIPRNDIEPIVERPRKRDNGCIIKRINTNNV